MKLNLFVLNVITGLVCCIQIITGLRILVEEKCSIGYMVDHYSRNYKYKYCKKCTDTFCPDGMKFAGVETCQCVPCEKGTYSNKDVGTKTCTRAIDCASEHKFTKVNSTNVSNGECGRCWDGYKHYRGNPNYACERTINIVLQPLKTSPSTQALSSSILTFTNEPTTNIKIGKSTATKTRTNEIAVPVPVLCIIVVLLVFLIILITIVGLLVWKKMSKTPLRQVGERENISSEGHTSETEVQQQSTLPVTDTVQYTGGHPQEENEAVPTDTIPASQLDQVHRPDIEGVLSYQTVSSNSHQSSVQLTDSRTERKGSSLNLTEHDTQMDRELNQVTVDAVNSNVMFELDGKSSYNSGSLISVVSERRPLDLDYNKLSETNLKQSLHSKEIGEIKSSMVEGNKYMSCDNNIEDSVLVNIGSVMSSDNNIEDSVLVNIGSVGNNDLDESCNKILNVHSNTSDINSNMGSYNTNCDKLSESISSSKDSTHVNIGSMNDDNITGPNHNTCTNDIGDDSEDDVEDTNLLKTAKKRCEKCSGEMNTDYCFSCIKKEAKKTRKRNNSESKVSWSEKVQDVQSSDMRYRSRSGGESEIDY